MPLEITSAGIFSWSLKVEPNRELISDSISAFENATLMFYKRHVVTQKTMPRKPSNSSAEEFFPDKLTLPSLREAAADCQACDLWERGTQTVFGEGRRGAEVLLVGEQPGNEEDLAGKPFVGPAGRLLDEALAAAGIDRSRIYVTNVVK